MITLLHISDLHLGWQPSFLGAKAKERAKERDSLLAKIVDLALVPAHGVDVIVIAGDLFEHHRPEAALVEETLRQLTRLAKGGKMLVTVPGNHDEISYRDSVYRQEAGRWPGVLVTQPMPYHVVSQEVRGQAIHFYSVAYTGGLTVCDVPLARLPRLDLPGIHIGVFHGSLDCPVAWRSLPLSSREFAAVEYDYVALGHFHQASTHRIGKGLASYCGAVEAKGLDDLGTGVVQLVQLSSSFAEIRSLAIPTRAHRLIELDLDDLRDEHDLHVRLNGIKEADAVVRLTLRGTPNCVVTKEKVAAVAEGLFYHCEVVDKMDALSATYLAELSRELSVRGYFVRRLLAEEELATLAFDKQKIREALRLGLRAFRGGL